MSKKIIFKQKGLLIVVIALFLSMNAKVVQAGNLNGNETVVISAAQGTFEHNGITYQADPVFVQQLISYLNQDDIDLNASQKDEAISMMFSNVGQGVAQGYLIPVSGQGEQDKEEQNDSADQGAAPDNSSEINSNDGENTDANTAGDGSSTEASGGDKDKGNREPGILNEIRKQPASKTEVDQNRNKVTVKKGDNSNIIVVNTVIKNTGFDLSLGLIVSAGIVIIFLFCVVITVKFNFFRQEEQEP